MKELGKKKNGLIEMDNSVVIAGGSGVDEG